jgi:hypothetical protein
MNHSIIKIIADAEDNKESAESILWRIKYAVNYGDQSVVRVNPNKPGEHRFTITTPKLPNGRYIVPEHKDIPMYCWGKEVSDRIIQFYK